MKRIVVLLVLVSVASVCLAEEPSKLQAKMDAVLNKICDPNTSSDAKIKAFDACFDGGVLELDPSLIETCNEKEYGKISLNDKLKKMCGMNLDSRRNSTINVSTNPIDFSLDFYLFFTYFYYLFSGNGVRPSRSRICC